MNFLRRIPPVTLNILAINIIVFLAYTLTPSLQHWMHDTLSLHYFTSPLFRPWQLLTYMFVQFGLMHLLFNMLAVYMFGSVVETLFGSKKYIFYYLACGIGAALIQEGIFALMLNNLADSLPATVTLTDVANMAVGSQLHGTYSEIQAQIDAWQIINTPMVGASGAVYGVLLAFGFLLPKAPIYMFFIPVPIQARWAVLIFGGLELLLGFTDSITGIAHFAHLGGLLVGLVMVLYWKKHGRLYNHPRF